MDNLTELPPNAVIDAVPSITDWIEGSITPVIRNSAGDWRKDEPPGEWQKLMGISTTNNGFNTGGVDFLDCVSFSANDAIETLMDHQMSLYHPENVQWLRDNGYMNIDGTMNFSDRYTAKISNTTRSGNSLPAVAEAIRTKGLVPETLWPMPIAQIRDNPNNYWEIYYMDIPQNVLDMGQEFLRRFKHNYEWVFYPGSPATLSTIKSVLQQTPLQIATAVCGGWNSESPIQGCGAGGQHATTLTYADNNGYYILDHYVPFDKVLAPNYDITSAMRHVVQSLQPVKTIVNTPPAVTVTPVAPVSPAQMQISLLQKLVALYQQLIAKRGTTSGNTTGIMQDMTTYTSDFMTLDRRDFLNGLVMFVGSSVLTFILPVVTAQTLPDFHVTFYVAATATITYLLKNYFSPTKTITTPAVPTPVG